MEHEICTFENRSASVRNLGLNESMHSSIGPEDEARIIYVEQSDFTGRLTRGPAETPLVLFDLGLGIAANPISALERIGAAPGRRVEIHSFESDPAGLELALNHLDRFPFLRRWESPVRALLKEGAWRSADAKILWELHVGDFNSTPLPGTSADLVYFDFYSPKSQPELWTEQVFSRIRAKVRDGGVLLTYSSSTAVRSALLLAGFFVGQGESTAAKSETTIGAADRPSVTRPLDRRFLSKLERSSHPSATQWLERLRSHPQFT